MYKINKKISAIIAGVILSSMLFAGCSTSNDKSSTNNTSGKQVETKKEETKEFKYYTAEDLKKSIEEEKVPMLVDIQVKEEYDEHHIKGAIATYAYPVKSDEDKAKFDDVLKQLKDSEDDIVIICPGGKGGAERTYNYLLQKDIKEERLYILKDGQGGWPYDELLEK